MTLEDKINKLPPYIYCTCPRPDHVGLKHFLTFTRDIQGKFTIGYTEFDDYTSIEAGGDFWTLEQAVDAMIENLDGRDKQKKTISF